MAKKLERETEEMCEKMKSFAQEVDAFSERKIHTLPKNIGWALLRASLALMTAASKVQLAAAKLHARDVKKHFAGTA